MSSPFEGDLGDWIGNLDYEEVTSKDYLMDEENRRNSKILNHAKTINLVENLNVFEEDRVLKKLAVENIKRHPTKYLRNWILNINRMFFGTPFSYSQQHPLATLRIMPNAILYSSLVFAIVGLLLFHKIKERKTLLFLLCFLLLYFWFSSLVTSMPRYIYTTTPLVLLIIGGFFNFIYNNLSKK